MEFQEVPELLPKEKPMYLDMLQKEITGINGRERAYFEQARQADIVMIVGGCDDSRQNVPQGTYQLEFEGKLQNIMMDFVPTIGGGVSREVLPAVIQRFIDQGIDPSKILVAVTQHGNSAEVNDALDGHVCDNPTCGLRGVLKQLESGEHPHLQHDLLKHAGEVNHSSSIITNGEYVYSETQRILQDFGIRVIGGYFDHEGDDANGKSLELVQGVSDRISISLPEQTAWHASHQDPQAIVVSVGPESATLPDGIVYPESVGIGANNDFNIASLGGPSLEADVSESWYPLHYVRSENSNFKTTQLMAFTCDNQKYIDQVKAFISSEKFTRDYVEYVRRLPYQGIYLINKATETVEFISFK